MNNLIDDLGHYLQVHGERSFIYMENGEYKSLNFDQLYQRVSQLSIELESIGVRRGMAVGIGGDNSLNWVLYDLALTRLGAVVIGLPQSLFSNDIDLIERFDLGVLLLSDAYFNRYAFKNKHLINIDRPLFKQSIVLAECEGAFSSDEISVTFSSGSSGNIKGLVISKLGADQQIRAYKDMFDIEHGRLIVYMPFTSYQQRLYVYGAITFGFDLVLVPPYSLQDGLIQMKPTILMGPPVLFETLARKLMQADTATVLAALGGKMHVMTTGMAKIRQDTIDFFHNHGVRLCEGYGLGECGSVCINTLGAKLPGSVGKPLPGTEVHLAADGEILVAKDRPLLSRYLVENDNSMDIQDTRLQDGWFYTGDLGRMDKQGNLYIEGRKKTTLVLKDGRKFQPEPIEKALEQAVEMKRVAILPSADQQGVVIAIEPYAIDIEQAEIEVIRDKVKQWFNDYTGGTYLLADVQISKIEFSPENGLLLRNLKLNRSAIAQYFCWEV